MPVVHAIIFDCFGVIRHDNMRPAYRKLGGDVAKDAAFIDETTLAANKGFIPAVGPVFAERLGVAEADWDKACREIGVMDQELLTYILGLRQHYKIGLLTNLGRGGLSRWFTPAELEQYFDVAIASGDVGHVKPDRDIYMLMAERLGVSPAACVMVDDRPECCEGAQAAGMQAIRYQDLPQLQQELGQLLPSTA